MSASAIHSLEYKQLERNFDTLQAPVGTDADAPYCPHKRKTRASSLLPAFNFTQAVR